MMKKYYVNWSVEGILSNWGLAFGRWYTPLLPYILLGGYGKIAAPLAGACQRRSSLWSSPGAFLVPSIARSFHLSVVPLVTVLKSNDTGPERTVSTEANITPSTCGGVNL